MMKLINNFYEQRNTQTAILDMHPEISWIYNQSGFAVQCEIQIVKSYFQFYECLKITFQPTMSEKPLFILDAQGALLGITELVQSFGYPSSCTFDSINTKVFDQLIQNKSFKVNKRDSLLNKANYLAIRNYSLYIWLEFEYRPLNMTVRMVELTESNPQQNKKINETGSKINPFQFHFGWNRKISDKLIEVDLPIFQLQDEDQNQAQRVNYG